MGFLRPVAVGLGLLVALTGCQGGDRRVATAAQFVTGYLDAARGGDQLGSWVMLGADIQSAQFSGEVETYLQTLNEADWGGLAWEPDTNWSDDDFVFVRLRTTAGQFPEYLMKTVNNVTIAPGDRGRVVFAVRFDWLGGQRLQGAGG